MARKRVFNKGDTVSVRVSFTDPDNGDIPTDPLAVALTVRTPAGVVSTLDFGTDVELVKESTGNYLYRLPLAEEGTYNWRWSGTAVDKAVVVPGACDSVRDVDF